MTGRDFLMILIGAVFGWAIIWVLVTFGGVALSALGAIFMIGFPIFAIVGFVGLIWWLVSGRKR